MALGKSVRSPTGVDMRYGISERLQRAALVSVLDR